MTDVVMVHPLVTTSVMLLQQLESRYRHYDGDPAKINFVKIPVTVINPDDDGVKEFNDIYEMCLSLDCKRIVRTHSGGISIKRDNIRGIAWDIRQGNACVEITIIDAVRAYRFQFRANPNHDNSDRLPVSGKKAFLRLREMCLQQGIDIDDYAVSNGKEIKKTIPKSMIRVTSNTYIDETICHCYHVDFHNSFPAGLANTHPEFKPVIDAIYVKRLAQKASSPNGKIAPKDDICKAIMNLSIGYMQSVGGCKARYATLARDAIADNNRRIVELSNTLKDNEYIPILYNTDGIWYYDPNNKGAYHGEGEGDWVGEWETDHKDCTLRVKSSGAYEFIEGDKYNAVVRGSTNYDKIVSRDSWQWGDIYRKEASINKYMFDIRKGIYKI